MKIPLDELPFWFDYSGGAGMKNSNSHKYELFCSILNRVGISIKLIKPPEVPQQSLFEKMASSIMPKGEPPKPKIEFDLTLDDYLKLVKMQHPEMKDLYAFVVSAQQMIDLPKNADPKQWNCRFVDEQFILICDQEIAAILRISKSDN